MHTIEPELLAPTPRKLEKLDGKSRVGFGCTVLFFLPFVIAGIGTFLYAFLLTVVLLFGNVVPGEVTGGKVEEDSDNEKKFLVQYRFKHGEEWVTGQDAVRPDVYDASHTGQAIRVRYFPPFKGTMSAVEGATERWGTMRFMWIFTTFWNLILSVFFKIMVTGVRKARRLLEFGTPTTATITEKRIQSDSDSTTYSVSYTFRPIQRDLSTREVTGSDRLTEVEWKKIQEGQTYTVLYLPEKPETNALYAFLPVKVAPR
jgi:hypothetical protein